MSKRRNEENTVDLLPPAKRYRIVHPLKDSDVHNQTEDPQLESSKAAEPSTGSVGKTSPPADEKTRIELPSADLESLPVELLRKIFSFGGTFRYGGLNLTKQFPCMALPVVNLFMLWRMIVSSVKVRTTHQLWKNIDEGDPGPGFDAIRQWIEAGEPHTLQLGPLDTGVDEDNTIRIPPQLISSCLRPTLRRLFITSLSAHDLAAIPPLADGLLELEELVLKLHDNDIGTLRAPIRTFANAPRLERVTVVNAVLASREDISTPARNNLEIPWEKIHTYLENQRNCGVECLPSIFHAPRLDNLTNLSITMPVYINTPATCDMLRKLSLPKLESLAIEASPDMRDEIPGFELFDYLTLPNLKHLAFTGHVLDFDHETWKLRGAEGQRFTAALSSFGHLESLSLSFPRIPSKTLRAISEAVKGIKKFDVHITGSKDDYKVVFEELTIKADGADTLLPSLECFSFDVANEKRMSTMMYSSVTKDDLFDFDAFSTFINSRRGPDLPSGISQLTKIEMFTDWDEKKEKARTFDLGLPLGVLTMRHILETEYWYLKCKLQRQQFRFLERFSPLDDAFEAKQFLPGVATD